MRKSITLRAFPNKMNTRERAELAREAGFDGVEVNLEPAEEYSLESDERTLKELRLILESTGIAVSAVNSRQQWAFPITSQDQSIRERGKEVLVALVKAAKALGTDAVLVIPGGVDNSLLSPRSEVVPYDFAYRTALDTLRDIAHGVASRYGVHLAVENVWNKFLLSPLEFAAFVDAIDSPWAGVYFDVGNVLRTGFPEQWIRILGSRIARVHVKDYRESSGCPDGFVALLEGDVNWPAVTEALKATGYNSWITAEVLPPYRFHGERLIFETSASMDAILGLKSKRMPLGNQ